jgi:hypothetical protein
MTRDEVINLLSAAIAYDNRNPTEAQIRAWFEAANRARWDYAPALDAIHAHYSRSSEYLMPGHITQALSGTRELPPRYRPALDGPSAAAPEHRAAVMDKIRSMLGRTS